MPRNPALLLILWFTFTAIACEGDQPSTASEDEIEEGTTVNDEYRQVVYDYYASLKKAQTIQQEREVITDFAAWLNEHDYKLQVEPQPDGSHRLACPYMPTVTPWTDYTFKDESHLDLLPKL